MSEKLSREEFDKRHTFPAQLMGEIKESIAKNPLMPRDEFVRIWLRPLLGFGTDKDIEEVTAFWAARICNELSDDGKPKLSITRMRLPVDIYDGPVTNIVYQVPAICPDTANKLEPELPGKFQTLNERITMVASNRRGFTPSDMMRAIGPIAAIRTNLQDNNLEAWKTILTYEGLVMAETPTTDTPAQQAKVDGDIWDDDSLFD